MEQLKTKSPKVQPQPSSQQQLLQLQLLLLLLLLLLLPLPLPLRRRRSAAKAPRVHAQLEELQRGHSAEELWERTRARCLLDSIRWESWVETPDGRRLRLVAATAAMAGAVC